MNLSRLFDQFLDEVIQRGTYATREEIERVSMKMLEIIQENKDATPEELVEKVIEDNVLHIEKIKNSYSILGYALGV